LYIPQVEAAAQDTSLLVSISEAAAKAAEHFFLLKLISCHDAAQEKGTAPGGTATAPRGVDWLEFRADDTARYITLTAARSKAGWDGMLTICCLDIVDTGCGVGVKCSSSAAQILCILGVGLG
jgi:hypothetical protein